MAKYPDVSMSVTRRLPRYYRYLGDLMSKGIDRISSREFAGIIGLTASQIRQDLNCFGGFGQQGYGYNVSSLYAEIGRILGVDQNLPTILIGVGHLGHALIGNMNFERRGFRLIGVFDNAPSVIGRTINSWTVLDVAGLEQFCREHEPVVAILCVPRSAAAGLADDLVRWNVKGFWNFSHYDLSLTYGDEVVVENVHLGDSLMTLSYYVNEHLESLQKRHESR